MHSSNLQCGGGDLSDGTEQLGSTTCKGDRGDMHQVCGCCKVATNPGYIQQEGKYPGRVVTIQVV